MRTTILGLPEVSVNLLSLGSCLFLICLGIRVIRASDIAFKVANTQLVTSNSADRLEQLAIELDKQAQLIEQKDEAYSQLTETYKRSLKGKKEYGRLQQQIEVVEKLPSADGIEQIKNEISQTEAQLLELAEPVEASF